MNKLYYSYVMGVNDDIFQLTDEGFIVEEENDHYLVTFPKEKSMVWEKFISKNLEIGFWNEYVEENVIFLFKVDNNVTKKYILDITNEKEVLELCCKFAETQFSSIKDMLLTNSFYKDKI